MTAIPAPAHQITPGSSAPAAAVDAILDVLATERRLVGDLTEIVERQRHALASDDLEGVDHTSHAMQRVLFTLHEARSRRRGIGRLLGGSDVPIRDIEDYLGDRMTDAVRDARANLRVAARRLSDAIEVNRRVLSSALAASDAYAARITGAPNALTYQETPAAATRRGGVLLNRCG
jgi:FlgN protein